MKAPGDGFLVHLKSFLQRCVDFYRKFQFHLKIIRFSLFVVESSCNLSSLMVFNFVVFSFFEIEKILCWPLSVTFSFKHSSLAFFFPASLPGPFPWLGPAPKSGKSPGDEGVFLPRLI